MTTLLTCLTWLALPAAADTCDEYGPPEPASVPDAPVDESSGLAASRTRPGVLFTHDDAGGDPVLYAVDLDGRYLGSHRVRDASLEDWEDLSPGPCPKDGEPCLYIGDIGDNDARRATIVVYVVREPAPGEDARRVDTWLGGYPDGPRDAETLLVHPCTGDVYVVTKRDGGGTVYRWPTDRDAGTLERVGEVVVPDGGPITGGQFDADGDRVVLRTRGSLWGWSVATDAPAAHWDEPPVLLGEVDEEQGEGVAFMLGGGLITSDEGHPLRLHHLPCDAEPSAVDCAFAPVGGCGCGETGHGTGVALLAGLAALARRRGR
jgi:hypothetical protein